MTGLHSCPACPNTTTRDDLCDNCDPAPLLAALADARVSPDAIRAAVEAEREEIAYLLDVAGYPVLARQVRSRGRVSLG